MRESLNNSRRKEEVLLVNVTDREKESEDIPSLLKSLKYLSFLWREIALCAFVGFASPWFIYLFIKFIVIGFIIRKGFKHKTNSIGG